MTSQEDTARRGSPERPFSLWTLVIILIILGCLFAPAALIFQTWRQSQIQTISVRLTSSGEVIWGEQQVSISAMRPEFQHSVRLLRSYGFKPRLLIESYSDARDSDIATLMVIGHEARFDFVDTSRLGWPSPEWSKKAD